MENESFEWNWILNFVYNLKKKNVCLFCFCIVLQVRNHSDTSASDIDIDIDIDTYIWHFF